jgi:hypothetical protein
LRLGTLVPTNTEVLTKYSPSQYRIVVFEIRLHSKSPMLYRPALHGNWNGLSLARRALKDKFPTPTVPLTTVLQNRQAFLPDPVYLHEHKSYVVTTLSNNFKFNRWETNPMNLVSNIMVVTCSLLNDKAGDTEYIASFMYRNELNILRALFLDDS